MEFQSAGYVNGDLELNVCGVAIVSDVTMDATLHFILQASFLTHTSMSLILNVTLPKSGDYVPDFGAFMQHRNRRRTLT